MRILIAEDEKDLNRLIEKKLTREGYSVDCTFDGKEALDFADLAEYDCVILDVMMPEVDGFTVAKRIRQRMVIIPRCLMSSRAL